MNLAYQGIGSLILVIVSGIGTHFLIGEEQFNYVIARAALEVFPVTSLVFAILHSGDSHFKKVLAFVLSALMLTGTGITVAAYFFYPPLVLTCTIIVFALIVPHYTTIDSMNQHILSSITSGVISFILSLVLIPITAFCITIGWAVTILPAALLVYAHIVTRCAVGFEYFSNPNRQPRFLVKILAVLSCALSALCIFSFFYIQSNFLTITAAITVTIMTYDMVDLECMEAFRANRSPDPILIVANGLTALGAAAVVGAARAAAAEPYLWEIGGGLVALAAVACLVDAVGVRRETDPHLDQPDPITSRVLLKIIAMAIVMLIMVTSIAGSYFYRELLPSIASPMPLASSILLFLVLFLLDNTRNNMARKLYIPFAIVFGCFSVAFAGAGIYMYLTVFTSAIMETIGTGFCISASIALYFVRTKMQKDKCEQLHLAALQLQQQIIPIAPAA